MATWVDFEGDAPELAAHGKRLLNQYGAPFGFLATVRRDGGPRVHPVCPVVAEGGLYVFVVSMSPKKDDLLRDPRYALHSFPPPSGGGEEFYVTGRASPVDDGVVRERVVAATGGTLGTHDFEVLFELGLEHVLYTLWANWGTAETWPSYTRWHAQG